MEEVNGRPPAPPKSSNSKANQAPSNGPDFGLLPRRAWQVILDYLDADARLADARLAVADLGPDFEKLVHGERCMRTVHCGANSESAALRSLLQAGRVDQVRTLQLTNCIATEPDSLLACVVICKRLTELRCVGCPLDAYLLLKVVTECLPSLERLYWSLGDRGNLGLGLRESSWTAASWIVLRSANALERVYVEVERGTSTSHSFLAVLVTRFPNLKRLHVHELRRDDCCYDEAEQLAHRIASCGAVLTYSTDGDIPPIDNQDFPASEHHALATVNRPARLRYSVWRNSTYPGGEFPGTRSPHWVSLDDI
ncbi:hypothetical protein MTO96_052068 [Rhipicephalus appendiculatus]